MKLKHTCFGTWIILGNFLDTSSKTWVKITFLTDPEIKWENLLQETLKINGKWARHVGETAELSTFINIYRRKHFFFYFSLKRLKLFLLMDSICDYLEREKKRKQQKSFTFSPPQSLHLKCTELRIYSSVSVFFLLLLETMMILAAELFVQVYCYWFINVSHSEKLLLDWNASEIFFLSRNFLSLHSQYSSNELENLMLRNHHTEETMCIDDDIPIQSYKYPLRAMYWEMPKICLCACFVPKTWRDFRLILSRHCRPCVVFLFLGIFIQ